MNRPAGVERPAPGCGLRRSVLAVVVAIGVAVLGMVAPAAAHSGLRSATPGPEEHLRVPPTQVQLAFRQPSIPDARTRVSVRGPAGDELAVGPAYASGVRVAQRLQPTAGVGAYEVSYAVVSVDGHLTTGSFRFWVKAAGADGGSSTRLLVLGPGLAVVAAIAWVVAVQRRRARTWAVR